MEFSVTDLIGDVRFKTARSGGKGGQHVNKVSSKVEADFNLADSSLFNEAQKKRIAEKLSGRMIAGGMIQVICDEERSQHSNKERCLQKLYLLLKGALHVHKRRKATKPKREAVEKRLKEKQLQATKKLYRRKDYF